MGTKRAIAEFYGWKLLGYGCYPAWLLSLVFGNAAFSSPLMTSEDALIVRIMILAGLVVGFCLVSAWGDAILRHRERFAVATAGSVVAGATLLLPVAPFLGVAGLSIACVSGFLAGAAYALLILKGAQEWLVAKADATTLCIMVGFALTGLVCFLCATLPPAASVLLMAALPLFNTIVLLRRRSGEAPIHPSVNQPLEFGEFKGRWIVALVVFNLSFGFVASHLLLTSEIAAFAFYEQFAYGVSFLFALIALAYTVKKSHEEILLAFSKPYTLLFVAGLLVLATGGPSVTPLGYGLVMVGYLVFDNLMWLLQPDIVFRGRESVADIFSKGRMVACLALLAGLIAGDTVATKLTEMGLETFTPICCVLLLTVVAVDTLVFTRHDYFELIAVQSMELDMRTVSERCDQLADEFSLSPREREVFLLLAKGRSYAYIQEALVISQGTVKTHSTHIYKKLGVGSRQEMLDLVEGCDASNRRPRA